MARLIYATIMSLDGFVADPSGSFDWAVPDDEVHAFINDLVRRAGTHLYGRRLYEVMAAWETVPTDADQPAIMRDFAETWRAADKVVYSRTLERTSSRRTRIERDFDPEAVRALKGAARDDLTIGGPELASRAFEAGLVDALHLFVVPIAIGAGKSALPRGQRIGLDLEEHRRFDSGVVCLSYRTRG